MRTHLEVHPLTESSPGGAPLPFDGPIISLCTHTTHLEIHPPVAGRQPPEQLPGELDGHGLDHVRDAVLPQLGEVHLYVCMYISVCVCVCDPVICMCVYIDMCVYQRVWCRPSPAGGGPSVCVCVYISVWEGHRTNPYTPQAHHPFPSPSCPAHTHIARLLQEVEVLLLLRRRPDDAGVGGGLGHERQGRELLVVGRVDDHLFLCFYFSFLVSNKPQPRSEP